MAGQALLFVLVTVGIAALATANIDDPLNVRRVEDIPRLPADFNSYRLPNDTKPVHYDVSLRTMVHQEDFSFTGSVAITVNVLTATNEITLHQRQLTIISETIAPVLTATPFTLLPREYNATTDMYTIPLAAGQTLNVGTQYLLTIQFSGTLRQDEAGFYRSSYLLDDNVTRRWLATTQFESTNARHGFPCYDEPNARATFTISITHGSTYHAVSNMPVNGVPIVNADQTTTTTFQQTPVTPTYLLAYIVSDFASVGNENIPAAFQQKVYARPNAIHGAAFGLQTGIDILNGFNTYFGKNFPLPKLDQAAIPDFAAGAMENWGLVTYREPYLLLFSDSTFTTRTNIVTVVAHEYAHQWFGNLVTPTWWTYIWLNEGFATLYEYYATSWVYPEWNILDVFVSNTVQNVMQSDANAASRPMTHYVESSQAVSNLFDNVAYAKSGSVLRMFLNAFTENTFKQGLVNYLNAKEYSDAVEEDLFAGLNAAVQAAAVLPTNLNVADIMLTWTRQAGFPVVSVDRVYGSNSITLRQERHLTVTPAIPDQSRWYIPLNFATATTFNFEITAAEFWFPNVAETTHTVTGLNDTDWLLVNKRETGYYRVKYDEENYQLLATELNEGDYTKIHLASRSQIMDDVFEFARRGRLNYTIVFDIIKYLHQETEHVPWFTAFNGLSQIDRMYAGSEHYDDFAEFILELLNNLFTLTGYDDQLNEPHFRKQARITAMNWACRLGNETCLETTQERLSGFLLSATPIHQNVRAPIYCNGMRDAEMATYTSFVNRLLTENDGTERNNIISGIACARNETLMTLFLQSTISAQATQLYRSTAERYRVFNDIAGNGLTGALESLRFLRTNMDALNTAYVTQNTINNAVTRLASFIVTDELRVEFELLLTDAATKTYILPNTLPSARAIVAENTAWITRNQADIENWIIENSASSMVVSTLLVTILLFITKLF